MLSQLNEDEKELMRMRYGDDLEHPVTDSSWSKKSSYNFYHSLVPKMKRALQNNRKNNKPKIENFNINCEVKNCDSTLSLEDYKKIKKMLNTAYTNSLASGLQISAKERLVICLKNMSLDSKKLSNENIANLLGIEVYEVETIISKITEMSDDDDEFSMKLKFN